MADVAAMYKEAFGAFTRGELEEAVGGFLKVVEADRGFALAYQGLAETYARLERLDDAIETIKKAIETERGAGSGLGPFWYSSWVTTTNCCLAKEDSDVSPG